MNKKKIELLDSFFSSQPKRNLTMGCEFECYLWDFENKRLFNNEDILRELLDILPKEITRDYYPYQLEIRTKPHNNPEEVIKEFLSLLKLCDEEFTRHNIKIVPLSWMGGDFSEMFNGVHMHFRNGNNNHFENTMFNVYPFVLAMTDCFKHSPHDFNNLSYRFANTQHCACPNLNNMMSGHRYSDIAMNRHRENSRHRLKNVNTIEVRTFDVPYNMDYFSNLIKLMFHLFQNINTKEKLMLYDYEKVHTTIMKTRNEVKYMRIGYNYFFDMYNHEIYDYLCDKFKVEKEKVPFALIDSGGYDLSREKKSVQKFLGEKEKKKWDKVLIKKRSIHRVVDYASMLDRTEDPESHQSE